MTIETQDDVVALKRIGKIVSHVLQQMLDAAEPGMTTRELDGIGAKLLEQHGARSAPMLSYGFPGATCISINEEAAHGIPGERVIRAGDVLNVDVSAELGGYFADTGGTRVVPPTSPQKTRLCHATRTALQQAMKQARAGRPLNGIGAAIQRTAMSYGFKVIENLGSHGVGRSLHEAPEHIPGYYDPAHPEGGHGDHHRTLPLDEEPHRDRARRWLDAGGHAGQPVRAVRAHDGHHPG